MVNAARLRQGGVPGTSVWLVLALALILAFWLVLDQRETLRSLWPAERDVEITLAGERYAVSTGEANELASLSRLQVAAGEREARALLREHLAAGLDPLFEDLSSRVPRFADWYYSLGGEYARISMWLLEKAQLADADFVSQRVEELIFDGADFDSRLQVLRTETDRALATHAQGMRRDWLDAVLERLAGRPAPDDRDAEGIEPVSLDELLEGFEQHAGPGFGTRLSASGVAAVGTGAGPVIWRMASRRLTSAAGAGAVARGAGRSAARAGVAAGSGAALCAPGGPAAVACALVAGGAGWVATDWGLLRLDEFLNRDALEASLQVALDELRRDMEQDLLAAYDAALRAQYGAMEADIERTFVPARSLGSD